MPKVAGLLSAVLITTSLITGTALAQEATPSIAVARIDQGQILSNNDIDVKRSPELSGTLALTFLAMNDMLSGLVDPDEPIAGALAGRESAHQVLKDLVTKTGREELQARASLAGHIARNPSLLDERVSGLLRRIGTRGTAMNSVKNANGAPRWEGYSTARDVMRIATSLRLTHGDLTGALFTFETDPSRLDQVLWIARDDGCVLSARMPKSGIELVAVIFGATSSENCLGAAEIALEINDDRLSEAVSSVSP